MGKPPIDGVNRHQKLVRAAVLAVEAFKEICQRTQVILDANGLISDNEARTYAAAQYQLESLTMALHGQKMRDEQVVIAVHDGGAHIESQSEFVNVTIKDYNDAPT